MKVINGNYTNKKLLLTISNKLLLRLLTLICILPALFSCNNHPADVSTAGKDGKPINDSNQYWTAPDISNITNAKQKELVAYGKELITHTAKYLGPKGSVMQISNGLNCQNCHLQAGTAIFGNNFSSVAALFPRFRPRSGTVETIYYRINDCLERSLNGKSLDTNSREMLAIAAYINFVGSNVSKGTKAAGAGLKKLAFLSRIADTASGRMVYVAKCQVCHKANGEGQTNTDGTEYIFPSLWGSHSYNDGAGLYRISNIAKFVKYNMPQGTTYKTPQLTDEEAWDVAAFICSQPRPHKPEPHDWPDISKKPVDHPFGPYADRFSEKQHKYGPFTGMRVN